jgi:predicted nucleic acid-binding protein
MKDVILSGDKQSAERPHEAAEFDSMMKRLSYVRAVRKFTRDEMNGRRKVSSTPTYSSMYRLSRYDSIIIGAAIESGCTTLYSEDMQHGVKFGAVQILDPFR